MRPISETFSRYMPSVLDTCMFYMLTWSQGILISSVSRLISTTTMSMLEDARSLSNHLQQIQELSSRTQSSESALAMTLTATDLADIDADHQFTLTAWRAFVKHLTQNQELPPSAEAGEDPTHETQMVSEFQSALRRTLMWRRFFTTSMDQIGTGPRTLKAGDFLVILPGSTVPFALRKRHNSYVMLGQVYVQGVMQGELLEEDFSPQTQWMTFNIK